MKNIDKAIEILEKMQYEGQLYDHEMKEVSKTLRLLRKAKEEYNETL